MPKYFPIEMNVEMKASRGNMVALYWRYRSVVADFAMPQDAFSYLRVRFDHADIVRILDEMPLSTEESTKGEGLLRDHFAYRVEDSQFWRCQSETFKFTHQNVSHYRFITANSCLDVISGMPPAMVVVPANIGPGQQHSLRTHQ